MTAPAGLVHHLRRLPTLVAALALAAACTELPSAPVGNDMQAQTLDPALGWVGIYDGWGEGVDQGTEFAVDSITMRIAFDADSVSAANCPYCVTLEFDPWFSRANLQFEFGSEAFFSYTEGDTVRSLSIQRFSGGNRVGNALLVKLILERTPQAGGGTLVDADFSLRAR